MPVGDDDDDLARGPPAPIAAASPRTKAPTMGAFDATMIRSHETADEVPTVVLKPRAVLLQGSILAGRYQIGALMGQGGMGSVYAARDGDLDEEVALKLLRPDLAGDEDYRKRLRAEVRLARRVSHPNVCRVHDLGMAGDLVFVTMELVSGRTVRQLLAEIRDKRLPPFELAHVVDVIVQIGSALTAAHRAGVIHRDVKPDNVMLTEGRAVLTDFGVATRSSERADLVAGTPSYLAPEVLLDKPFDHKVDVYALAVMAYELLAGQPPFLARSMEDADRLAIERPAYPALPDHLANPEVRAALDRVLQRALAADPALRTSTIDRFTEAFAVAARGAPSATTAIAPVTEQAEDQPNRGEVTPPLRRGADSVATRRPEVRVATAFVWRADVGATTDAAETVERIVVDAGGVPIRVGDSEVLALFGAVRSVGDDAERAARAGLSAVAAHGGRAGIDVTRVLWRPGTSELATPRAAAGADALLASAAPGEVIASATAARQLMARFEIATTIHSERRKVVGVRAFVVAEPPKPSSVSYRARELTAVAALVERAFHERVPVHVEVRGGPGMGKTRLREALVATISARREVEWLVAVASPIGAPAPLSTIEAASSEWFEAATGRGAITDPTRRRNAARRWLETRATRCPVVIVVEDVQWADPSTQGLLEHLRSALDDVPVAILTFARSDDTAAPVGMQVVTLSPLDATAATRLAREIAPEASAEVIAKVVTRAAGNPFFIEELARELTSHPESSTLPVSIEAVIQTRLDHISESASHVALAAAVIGRTFWRSAIMPLVELDALALDAALGELERQGIVHATVPVSLDDDRYEFTQHLVRDVAYQRIPAAERRVHHRAVAAWLEARTVGDRKDNIALVLDVAHHREQAGDIAGACAAYRRAGTRCLAEFANPEAATALRRAVELAATPDAALHEELGDAIAETAGASAAEAAYQAAVALITTDEPSVRARLGYKLAVAAGRRGDTATAIERYRAALALALPDGHALAPWATVDPRIAAKLLGGLGWTLGYQLGRVEEGHPMCERAVALLEGTQYQRELAFVLSRLGGTYMRACRFADQLRTNQRSLEIGRELGDLGMQVTAHVNLGVVYNVLGAIDDAIASTIASRELAIRTGATGTAGLAASNLGGLLIEQGRIDEARAALDEAQALIARTGHRYVLCETYAFQARAAAASGDLPTARHHAERSLALARELGNPLDAAIARRILAQIMSRAGDHTRARTQIDEALDAIARVDAFETVRTRAARARILKAAGDPTAGAELDAVRAELERLGARRELAILEDMTEVR